MARCAVFQLRSSASSKKGRGRVHRPPCQPALICRDRKRPERGPPSALSGYAWYASHTEPCQCTGASGETKPAGVTFSGGEKVRQSRVVTARTP